MSMPDWERLAAPPEWSADELESKCIKYLAEKALPLIDSAEYPSQVRYSASYQAGKIEIIIRRIGD